MWKRYDWFTVKSDWTPLLSKASFGADRNERGGKKLRFPIYVRTLASLTSPRARVASEGSWLELPPGWGIYAVQYRALEYRVLERDEGARVLDDGRNFAIVAGPAGAKMTIAARLYNKCGKWSHFEYNLLTITFEESVARVVIERDAMLAREAFAAERASEVKLSEEEKT